MQNEKILIFGDSYSTYKGYAPEGFNLYYPKEGSDVDDVSKTWWKMLECETGSEIIHNNSWSGSTVCNTGYDNYDCSKTSSFIHRLKTLIEEGFFEENKLDRIFVFGGTNDCWTENALGEFKYSQWTEADLKLIMPGYSYFISTLLSVAPKEKIHIIINNELKKEVEEGFVTIAKHYAISYTLISDIDKTDGHPTYKGMQEIKNQVLRDLK